MSNLHTKLSPRRVSSLHTNLQCCPAQIELHPSHLVRACAMHVIEQTDHCEWHQNTKQANKQLTREATRCTGNCTRSRSLFLAKEDHNKQQTSPPLTTRKCYPQNSKGQAGSRICLADHSSSSSTSCARLSAAFFLTKKPHLIAALIFSQPTTAFPGRVRSSLKVKFGNVELE